MHTHSMHINLLGVIRPKARHSAVLKVFPSEDELFLCLLLMVGILLGLIAACARIC